MKYGIWVVAILVCVGAVVLGQSRGRPTQVVATDGSNHTFMYNESHALLVGNVNYRDSGFNRLGRIPDELNALRASLEKQGFVPYQDKVYLDLTERELRGLIEPKLSDSWVV